MIPPRRLKKNANRYQASETPDVPILISNPQIGQKFDDVSILPLHLGQMAKTFSETSDASGLGD